MTSRDMGNDVSKGIDGWRIFLDWQLGRAGVCASVRQAPLQLPRCHSTNPSSLEVQRH